MHHIQTDRATATRRRYAVVVFLVTALLPLIQAPSEGSEPSIAGTITDELGLPVVNQAVDLYFEPTQTWLDAAGTPDHVELTLVATDTTDTLGRFEFYNVALTDPVKFQHEDGSVLATILANGATGSVLYQIHLSPPTSGSGAWTYTPGDEPDYSVVSTEEAVEFDSDAAAASATQLQFTLLPAIIGSTLSEPQMTTSSTSSSGSCNTQFWAWIKANSWTYNYKNLQHTKTLSKLEMKYSYQTTKTSKLETSGYIGGKKVAMGLTYSTKHSTGIGWNFPVATNKNLMNEVQWAFRRWNLFCSHDAANWFYSGDWQYRPDYMRLSSQQRNVSLDFTCAAGSRNKISVETWLAKSSSVTWKGDINVISLPVRSWQKNADNHSELTIKPRTSGTPGYVCGSNNADLTKASRIKETA